MTKSPFLLVCLLWLSRLCFAQTYKIQELTVADGLSQGMVVSILQDRQGFMWFATRGGLDRYDGYRFKHYTNIQNDSSSLPENIVTALAEDNQGRIWLSTENNGLACFDPQTEKFHPLGFTFNTLKVPNPQIIQLFIGPDNYLWITTATGITKVSVPDDFPSNPQAKAGIQYTMYALGKNLPARTSNATLTSVVLPEGLIGVAVKAAANEFLSFDPLRKTWKHHPIEPFLAITEEQLALSGPHNNHTLWFIRSSHLYCWKEGKVQFGSLLIYPTPTPLNDNGNEAIHQDAAGNLWIVTNNGLYLISSQNLQKGQPILVPILTDHVKNAYLDRQQRLWVGTTGYGLRTLLVNKPKMEHWLPKTSVYRMWPHQKNCLLVGLPYPHLALTDQGEPSTLPVPLLPEFTYAATPPQNNTLYTLTGRVNEWGFLNKYAENADKPTFSLPFRYRCQFNEPLLKDRRGNVWIGFTDGKIACLWNGTDSLRYYDYHSLWQKPQSIQTKAIYESANGTVWLSTTQGLVEMTPAASQKVTFRLRQSGGANQLSSNAILSVLDDPAAPQHFLWVCTNGGGLNKMDKRTGLCIRYTKQNGLPDDVVYGVLPDNNGNLWMSTNFGISRFNPAKNYFRNYTAAEDGLQDNEFNTASFFKHPDGRLMFGGINGISVFNPKDFAPDTSFAPVFFTELKVNNQVVNVRDSSGILKEALEQTNVLPLLYNQNFLTLSFAALDFKQMGKSNYYYKMEGVDADWVFGGQRTEVSYPNLSPGTYTLSVANINEAGDRNPHPAVITFEISPPWWRSWVAYFLYALTVGGLAYRYFQFRLRRIKLQNELHFKEKEAQQLQALDELKNRFFNNVTHEFRTPLTLIIEPARQLLKSNDGVVKSQAGIIYNNSNRLLELVNQLLDIAKLEDGKLNLHFVEGDLLLIVRDIFDFFAPLAQTKRLTLVWDCSLSRLEGVNDRQLLEKVTYNLLSNAVKFTPEGGTITLKIVIAGASQWQLSVADTGIGIAPEQLPHIFDRFYQADSSHTRRSEGTGIGLALVKELLNLINGTIEVHSTVNKGTQFRLTLPVYAIPQAVPLTPYSGETDLPTDLASYSIPNEKPGTEADENTRSIVLVAEDNAEMRQYLRMVLQQGGYTVLEAANGALGVELAMEYIPDLIISDIMMPEKDGYELTELLKNNLMTSHIPIVLLTAKGKPESKLEGYRRGADAYLPKPFHTEELLIRMQQLLEVRRALQQKYALQTAATDLPATQNAQEEETPELSPLDVAFMARIYQYMEENLNSEQLSIENLTREFAMSRSQLFRKITTLTGVTPARLVRNYRMNTAYRLLQEDKKVQISEVMLAVGFDDPKYFARVFREYFHVSPQSVAKKK